MKIIIAGCGKVGYILAEQLNEEGHEITIIDTNEEKINMVGNLLDVMCIQGNATSYHVQEEAGVKEADLLIAVTNKDEVNLLCCLIARKAGHCQTIARVRDPGYYAEIGFIKEELGLTVSIGVSYNKIFAKLGSDMKKPDAVTEISKETFQEKVWPLPASDLLFVGRATEARFRNYGIHTIGDIAATDPAFLKRLLGVNGLQLWKYAAGKDDTPVMHKDFVSPIKSEGHGITCVADLLDNEKVWKVMLELSQDIGHRLRLHKLKATGVQISIRSNDLGYRQFQAPLSLSTQSPMMIAKKAHAVFQTNYRWSTPVRAVTVRAINLVPQGVPEQIDLFTDMRRVEKAEKLDDCIEEIRRRFGKRAVFQACLLGDLKMPIDNRHLVQMPGVVGR